MRYVQSATYAALLRGVFVTTATFTKGAIDYAKDVPVRVLLIDGRELTRHMPQYRMGVTVSEQFELMELDDSHFED